MCQETVRLIEGDAAQEEGCESCLARREKVKAFYERQVILHPDNPAILGVAAGLPADCRDFFEWSEFNRLVPLQTKMRVLELGCGGGRWCEHFATVVAQVTGVDLSQNAIALARNHAKSKSVENVDYHVAAMEDFQPQETYDLIYFSSVALYLDDVTLLKSLIKYGANLNDNGFMVVRESVANEIHLLCHDEGYSAQYRTIGEFERLFALAGFALVDRRRSFPRVCLSPFLNSIYIQRLYRLTRMMSLENFFFRVLSRIFFHGERVPHWLQNGYSYNHDFLLFTREGNKPLK